MNNTKLSPKVCVVSFPWESHAPYKFISDILLILEPISSKIVLLNANTKRIKIKSGKVEVIDIGITLHYFQDIEPKYYSAILWVIKCFLFQINVSIELVNVRNNIDVILFYMAYPYYLLPLITAKILRKKTVEVITRSKSNFLLTKILTLQDTILFKLLDGISPESKVLIKDLYLKKYKNKLLPEGARFIDTTRYTIKKKLIERKNLVGFIGRLNIEKGIKEFVKAIPLIAEKNKNIEFIIIGDGNLKNWTDVEVNKIKIEYGINIIITGWIGEDLPDYLNELKLLVLPSHNDAFPTIILEAMACGTPVLATPVGGIPDLIKNGDTGFFMKNNLPTCIAKNIISCLNNINLCNVSINARKIISKKYTYESAVKRFNNIINGKNELYD